MTKAEKYHLLHSLAEKYETHDFLKDDPSYFMHQVKVIKNHITGLEMGNIKNISQMINLAFIVFILMR